MTVLSCLQTQPGPPRVPRRAQQRASGSAAERPELVPQEVEGHHERQRQRLREDLAPPEPVEEDDQPQLIGDQRDSGNRKEPHPLIPEVTLRGRKRPAPVPPVVAGGGENERDRSCAVRPEPK